MPRATATGATPAPGFTVYVGSFDRRDPAHPKVAVVDQTTADATGSFAFNSILEGGYDVVAVDAATGQVGVTHLAILANATNSTAVIMEATGAVEGVVFNAQGLGLAPLINGTSADTPNVWQSDSEIKAALSKLDAALNLVRSQASDFGSNLTVLQTRQDFTKQSIATLNAGSDLLVLADVSEEGANLLALQTRQQLSTQALSLSAQTDQAVLRLFG